MSRAVVPIGQLARRIPEAGRIRIGQKQAMGNGKARPAAIGEFRFTSHDRSAIEQIAALYGGTVRGWSDPKAAAGQVEVVTDASEIRVVLPPDPLGGGPVYELWGGGGCERRCDGVTCTTYRAGPEGPEPVDVDCMCSAAGALACKPTTRLSVILPEVRFAGVWRLDTKSWNAAQELPGMVDLIHQAQGHGLQYATLAIKHRRSTIAGQTRTFLVPVLGTDATVEQLAAGETALAALPSTPDRSVAPSPALETGDDDVVDAEIVRRAIDVKAELIAAFVDRGASEADARAAAAALWQRGPCPTLGRDDEVSDADHDALLALLPEPEATDA